MLRLSLIISLFVCLFNCTPKDKKQNNADAQNITDSLTCYFYSYNTHTTQKTRYRALFQQKNDSEFVYEYYSPSGPEIICKFNFDRPDTLIFNDGSEEYPLKLIKDKFITMDSLNERIYVYATINPPIDGSALYFLTKKYGLIFIKSETWNNYKKLYSLQGRGFTEQSDKELQFIFDRLIAANWWNEDRY